MFGVHNPIDKIIKLYSHWNEKTHNCERESDKITWLLVSVR